MTDPDSTQPPEQGAATFAEATGSETTQPIALASGMEKPNGGRVPCACVHYDATDCARIRDGFDSDDPRYEGRRRKCGCLCHNHEDVKMLDGNNTKPPNDAGERIAADKPKL